MLIIITKVTNANIIRTHHTNMVKEYQIIIIAMIL